MLQRSTPHADMQDMHTHIFIFRYIYSYTIFACRLLRTDEVRIGNQKRVFRKRNNIIKRKKNKRKQQQQNTNGAVPDFSCSFCMLLDRSLSPRAISFDMFSEIFVVVVGSLLFAVFGLAFPNTLLPMQSSRSRFANSDTTALAEPGRTYHFGQRDITEHRAMCN